MGRPGIPEQMWLKMVCKPMNTAGIIRWDEAAELAKDRESWKQKGDLFSLPLCAT